MNNTRYSSSSQKMHWNIAGGIRFTDLILNHLDTVNSSYNITLYDSYFVSWSGGRNTSDRQYDRSHLEQLLDRLSKRGIGLFFTFSSHVLTARDLTDSICNEILSIAHAPGNGVIVTCDFLADYINDKYPDYTVTYSVINSYLDEVILWSDENVIEYYNQLSNYYDIVVIAPELNRRFDLISHLPVDSIEVLVNEQCASHCPNKNMHYSHEASKNPEPWAVPCPKNKGELVLSYDEINTLRECGVSRFKIQGRTYSADQFSDILSTYL
ncbi:hypothetical protein ACFL1R_01300 [Candidatus Latescibacterota bacterium]